MKWTMVIRILCYACIVGALASRIFIPDKTLGSILAIVLMALSIILLGFVMYRMKRK